MQTIPAFCLRLGTLTETNVKSERFLWKTLIKGSLEKNSAKDQWPGPPWVVTKKTI